MPTLHIQDVGGGRETRLIFQKSNIDQHAARVDAYGLSFTLDRGKKDDWILERCGVVRDERSKAR